MNKQVTQRCQEWGIINSHFKSNALQFNLLTALQEKIDNSYSADANLFLYGLFKNHMFIYDDKGMTYDELDKYLDLYRGPKKNQPHRNSKRSNIGKHGLGGKEADYKFSTESGLCNIITSIDGEHIYKVTIDFKRIFEDLNNDSNLPWSKNVKIEESNFSNFEIEILSIINNSKKIGTLFYYYNNDVDQIFTELKELSQHQLGLAYEDKINEGFKIQYYFNNELTSIKPYDPLHKDKIRDKTNENFMDINKKLYYKEHKFDVRNNNDLYLIETTFMGKEIRLRWNKKYNRCQTIKKTLDTSEYTHFGNFNFKISYLLILDNFEEIKKNEQKKFDKCLFGCRFKRYGVLTGPNSFCPKKGPRMNENYGLRCVLSYDLGSNSECDIFFNPGINKSQITPVNLIHTIVKELMQIFRGQFPKTKQEMKTQKIQNKTQKLQNTVDEIKNVVDEILDNKIENLDDKIDNTVDEIKNVDYVVDEISDNEIDNTVDEDDNVNEDDNVVDEISDNEIENPNDEIKNVDYVVDEISDNEIDNTVDEDDNVNEDDNVVDEISDNEIENPNDEIDNAVDEIENSDDEIDNTVDEDDNVNEDDNVVDEIENSDDEIDNHNENSYKKMYENFEDDIFGEDIKNFINLYLENNIKEFYSKKLLKNFIS